GQKFPSPVREREPVRDRDASKQEHKGDDGREPQAEGDGRPIHSLSCSPWGCRADLQVRYVSAVEAAHYKRQKRCSRRPALRIPTSRSPKAVLLKKKCDVGPAQERHKLPPQILVARRSKNHRRLLDRRVQRGRDRRRYAC